MSGKATADLLEKGLDAIYTAEFLMIVVGEDFADEGRSNPLLSELCTPALLSKPNKFMGFWGELLNKYQDRMPHDGLGVLMRWRDQFFSAQRDDMRKRKQNKKKNEDDDDMKASFHKCFVVTGSIDGHLIRAGFTPDQIYEMSGSVTEWQCSVPCKQEFWTVARAFRFEIDPTNREAKPIKFVSDERNDAGQTCFVVDDDDEPLLPMKAGPHAHLHCCTPIRIYPSLQRIPPGYHDSFKTGLPTSDAESPEEYLFEPPPLPATPTGEHSDTEPSSPTELYQITPYEPIQRMSHRLQHVKMLQRNEYTYQEGVFALGIDPALAIEQRKAHFSFIQPFFNPEDPKHLPYFKSRQANITYNISIVIVDSNKPVPDVSVEPLSWEQGNQGMFFFSNVKVESTYQEPCNKRFVDVFRVRVPETREIILPTSGRLSVVLEMIIGPKDYKRQKGSGQSLPIPNPYRRLAFQLCGGFNNVQGQTQTVKSDDEVWHVLTTSEKTLHLMRIVSPANNHSKIVGFEWEIANEDEEPPRLEDIGTVRRIGKPVASGYKSSNLSRNTGKRPLANHQLCVHCHNTARPRVQMNPKDTSLIPISRKPYLAWEKWAMDLMKTDGSRFTILELGCSKKLDACRKHSESVWKKVKNSGKAMFLRISAEEIEAKKGAGGSGGGGGDQFISIQADPKEMLKKLDRLLAEKVRKKLQ